MLQKMSKFFKEALAAEVLITFNDFLKVDIRVGTIQSAEEFPEAHKPAYKLIIDFGSEIGVRKTSAQITKNYLCSDLVGTQVLAVTNFPPKQIGPFMSEVLVLGAADEKGDIILARPSQFVPNGSHLH